MGRVESREGPCLSLRGGEGGREAAASLQTANKMCYFWMGEEMRDEGGEGGDTQSFPPFPRRQSERMKSGVGARFMAWQMNGPSCWNNAPAAKKGG